MVTMLYKTNIFGIVGSDNNKEYKQNQVVIWDDFANKILYKITLNEKVLNLKLRRDKVFIVCKQKIYILNPYNEYNVSGILETGLNPNGLIAINYTEGNTIIVYPSSDENKEKGELTIKNLDNNDVKYHSPHNHKVAYISLSYNGLLLATASEDGKKIRIFEKNGKANLPVCVAKTQYSFSDDAKKLGAPENFEVTVKDIRLYGGANFITVLLGDIMVMPGLSRKPNFEIIDVVDGEIVNLS